MTFGNQPGTTAKSVQATSVFVMYRRPPVCEVWCINTVWESSVPVYCSVYTCRKEGCIQKDGILYSVKSQHCQGRIPDQSSCRITRSRDNVYLRQRCFSKGFKVTVCTVPHTLDPYHPAMFTSLRKLVSGYLTYVNGINIDLTARNIALYRTHQIHITQ